MRSGGRDFSRLPDVLEVTDETTRKPTSNPLSASPYLRALRVNQPEARSRRSAPLPIHCRMPRAEGGTGTARAGLLSRT